MTRQEQIQQQAAYWLMRREEPEWTPEDESRLELWLQESVAHKAAYWRLEHGWGRADCEAPRRSFWSLPVSRPRLGRSAALAASLLIAMLGAGWIVHQRSDPVEMVRYSTGRGQTSSLRLTDGSQIELNTDTSLRIERSGDRRAVWLDRGEAFFAVAHDAKRPFVVHSGARNVTVLGTKFNIQRGGRHMTVSVVEGRVRLVDPADSQNLTSVVIARGDMAVVDGTSTLIASGTLARIERELLWRRGLLSFNDTRLSDVVEQFNRYNRTQLVIDDPQVANIRIGGTFRTSNAESFAALLQDSYGIDMRRQGEIIILDKIDATEM